MKIVTANQSGISQAVAVLKASGVIIFPTDTAYGLGGIFDSARAQKRILKIKGRRNPKFTLVASSLAQVEKFFTLNPVEKNIAKKYWPGPLSIVVSPQFAIRVPKNEITRQLCRRVGKPLIATSANRSGRSPLYDHLAVSREFKRGDQSDLFLSAGRLKKQKPSTVVRVDGKQVIVVRSGPVVISG